MPLYLFLTYLYIWRIYCVDIDMIRKLMMLDEKNNDNMNIDGFWMLFDKCYRVDKRYV